MNHVLEHVSKGFHASIFLEANRVLKPGGELFIAYPDFIKCAQEYIDNNSATREFWEWTIYGRQCYAGDFHVCAVTEDYLRGKLTDCGFKTVSFLIDPQTKQYTNALFVREREVISYEEAQSKQWQS